MTFAFLSSLPVHRLDSELRLRASTSTHHRFSLVPLRTSKVVPKASAAAITVHTSFPSKVSNGRVVRDKVGLPVLHVDGISRSSYPPIRLLLLLAFLLYLARRRIIKRHLDRPYSRTSLKLDIASFYDLRSAAWETVWGEHLHHGLYDIVDGRRLHGTEAQEATITELLRMGGQLPEEPNVLDVGCGIGGASRFIAQNLQGARVTGITLSPKQAERATELNREMGLDERVKNEVRDAMNNGFKDQQFDIVWSLESAEHMPDKMHFVSECARVLKPGGKMLMLAWCIREPTTTFKLSERFAIRRIMEEYCLPRLAPPSEYVTEMVRSGLRDVQVDDWTKRAAPFWGEVVRSALFNPKGWQMLWKFGWPLIRSSLAMRHVIQAIRLGTFRLVAFSAVQPTEEQREREAERERQRRGNCALPLEL